MRVELAVALAVYLVSAGPAAVAAPAPQYHLATETAAQATVIDLASRVQSGSALTFDVSLLRRTPAQLTDMDVYWGDGRLQIECLDHQMRLMLVSGWTLDRARRFDEPSPVWRPWSADVAGTPGRALEDWVCHGVGAAAFPAIADLGGFARDYLGGGTVAAAPTTPRAAASPTPGAAVSAEGLAPYYSADADKDGAVLVATAGMTRRGAVVSLAQYSLSTTSLREDPQAYWVKSVAEYDCAGHRNRDGLVAELGLDLRARSTQPLAFGDWYAVTPGTPGAAIEQLACHGKVSPVLIPVQSLADFQQALFQWAQEQR